MEIIHGCEKGNTSPFMYKNRSVIKGTCQTTYRYIKFISKASYQHGWRQLVMGS